MEVGLGKGAESVNRSDFKMSVSELKHLTKAFASSIKFSLNSNIPPKFLIIC